MAVEVHQSDSASPDVVFGLSLQAVIGPMVIFRQPDDQAVYPGETVVFSVEAAGSPPWDYQWQFNGADLAGQTQATLTLTNVLMLIQGGRYRVLIRNAYGTAASSEAVLGVKPVVVWGSNTYGQTNVPVIATDVVAIAAGGSHSLALRADGTVVGWGLNSLGQATGIPTTSGFPHSSSGGVTLAGQPLTGVVAIAAGSSHSLALRADGTVVGWGITGAGRPPVFTISSDPEDPLFPSGVVTLAGQTLEGVVAIAAAGSYSLALKTDGTVVGWGYNQLGQATGVPTTHSPHLSSGVVTLGDMH